MRPTRPSLAALGVWLAAAALSTLLLWRFRHALTSAHMALTYLLVVLFGSARQGRMIGFVLSVVCFLSFNFFLLPPYYTFRVRDPLDWWVLASFLITGSVAAQLFHRARRASESLTALREADRLKDALLASVSHDLRTPLTTIRALASDLRVEGEERAATIEEEADRLNRMVGDLLDLSRIRAGVMPVEPEVIAAEDLVGAVLQRVSGLPGSERIQARVPPGAVLPVGKFDFVHSMRVLVNLLENALRHSAAPEPVELVVTEEGNDLVFTVLDRGEGIAEADRDRIFEPFFRRRTDDHRRRGAGLGLSIARTLAEAQGGAVRYVPRPGGGSVFELRLPAERIDVTR